MEQFSNRDKQEHGQNAKIVLEEVLKECEKYSYIKQTIKEYRCGYKDYDNKQFYCNFIIVFQDNTKWIVNITTSFRSDRLKGNQWDSYNIKEIDSSISKSVLVYPDDLSEEKKQEFIHYKFKINNHIHFSAINEIVGQNELFELIENYANRNLSIGKKKDRQGNNFESYIANILSNKENFNKWKNGDPKVVGKQYHYFEKIINFFNLSKNEIIGISATSDKKRIGYLKSSGNPKTDIIVTAFFANEDKDPLTFSISCKKSNAKNVSVHQYTADAFANVLDENNVTLRILLQRFQKFGNLRDFGTENKSALEKEMKPYLKKFIKWVLGGYGGKYQSVEQLAEYILISDGKDIFIHTIDEYTQILLKPENTAQFGTPFQWTFASGRKGKDIQLKCKIIK